MKKYGLQIGDRAVEFSDQQTREKALLIFTKGSCVKVRDSAGVRYSQDSGTFSTYERETNEQTMNCGQCQGQFSSETCTNRNIPKRNWSNQFTEDSLDKTDTAYLCDGCYAKVMKDFEVFRAKQVIANNQ